LMVKYNQCCGPTYVSNDKKADTRNECHWSRAWQRFQRRETQ
jgi:hypothetical protein